MTLECDIDYEIEQFSSAHLQTNLDYSGIHYGIKYNA